MPTVDEPTVQVSLFIVVMEYFQRITTSRIGLSIIWSSDRICQMLFRI
jgi:hypothetical protein